MTKKDSSYFIDTGSAPRIAHAPGVETTILSGRHMLDISSYQGRFY